MTAAAITVDDLTVRLNGYEALRNLSFEIPEGAFTAVIGPNGAGKSTLLRTLLGLLTPVSGSVFLAGQPPARIPANWIGYVPQVKNLDREFPALALELVATGLSPRWPWRLRAPQEREALRALEQAGAGHLAYRPVGRLSGGELQRVYLARGFARKSRYILLDEPAAGLDAAGEADMYHILEAYQREHQSTVLMITHDWDGARLHAALVLLLNRTLLGFGPPAAVLNKDALLNVFGHTGHAHPPAPGASNAPV